MTKIGMKSKGAVSHSSVMKRMRLISVAAVLLICCLAFVGVVGAEESTAVAKVGDTEYDTIDEAIEAWTTNGGTLTLLADVTLSDTVTLTSPKDYILNLGTYTMTAADGKTAINIQPTSAEPLLTLTINADSENSGGITATKSACIANMKSENKWNPATIQINGGIYVGNNALNLQGNNNKITSRPNLTITGGTFNALITLSAINELQISGGTFNLPTNADANNPPSLRSTNFKSQISGGMFNVPVDFTISSKNTPGDLLISGGMFNNQVSLTGNDGDILQISGGTFSEEVIISTGELQISSESSVTVKDYNQYILIPDSESEPDENGVVTYTYKPLPLDGESYIITFNTNGGSSIGQHKVKSGTTVPEPVLTKEGHTFENWYSDSGFEDVYDFDTPVTEALTLYAKWTINQYTITFIDGGSEIDKITKDFGTDVTAPADPTKDGYTFTGWDKEIPATMPAEDITINALWEKITVEEPTITPSSGSSSSGSYFSFPRTTTNGGLVDFGSSKVVKALMLPEGSSGSVVLKVDTVEKWPKALETEYTFDISVEKLGVGMAYIHFEIPEAKLTALELTAADICAYHYEGEVWTKLPTTYEVKDGIVCYEAETESFSPFKLVIEKGAAVQKEEEIVPTVPPVEEPEDTPVDKPEDVLQPIEPIEPTEPTSPAPLLSVLAGLGAAVLLRRR